MARFLVAYRGGEQPDASTVAGDMMSEWMAWFESLGASVVEGGNPFSGGVAIAPDGSRSSDTAGLTGYSIIEASSLDEAATAVAGCPQLKYGGSVEVYETLPM